MGCEFSYQDGVRSPLLVDAKDRAPKRIEHKSPKNLGLLPRARPASPRKRYVQPRVERDIPKRLPPRTVTVTVETLPDLTNMFVCSNCGRVFKSTEARDNMHFWCLTEREMNQLMINYDE